MFSSTTRNPYVDVVHERQHDVRCLRRVLVRLGGPRAAQQPVDIAVRSPVEGLGLLHPIDGDGRGGEWAWLTRSYWGGPAVRLLVGVRLFQRASSGQRGCYQGGGVGSSEKRIDVTTPRSSAVGALFSAAMASRPAFSNVSTKHLPFLLAVQGGGVWGGKEGERRPGKVTRENRENLPPPHGWPDVRAPSLLPFPPEN